MFRYHPYLGLLFISIALWATAVSLNYRAEQKRTPQYLVAAVGKDLEQKLAAYDHLRRDTTLLSKACNGWLDQQELNILLKEPFYFSLFVNGRRAFWNNNKILDAYPPPTVARGFIKGDSGRSVSYGACDTLSVGGSQCIITASLPVSWIFPFENAYLRSHWEAAGAIPATTAISNVPKPGYLPVNINGRTAFYVNIPAADILPGRPAAPLVWLTLAALLFAVSWVQMMALYYAKKYNASVAYGCLFLLIIAVRFITYRTGLPFHLRELDLFSPLLYASNDFLPSLGDLILNALCIGWMFLCVLIEVPYRRFFTGKMSSGLRLLAGVPITCIMACYAMYVTHMIRSIVSDSNIPFDVGSFYTINVNTFIGLFAIALLMSISVMMAFFMSALLRNIWPQKYVRLLLLAIVSFICFYALQQFTGNDNFFHYSIWLLMLLFLLFMNLPRLHINADLFSPNMIFWAMITCLATTFILQYFSYTKEKETRKSFAARLGRQKDPEVQYQFLDVAGNISRDETIRSFLRQPSPETRSALDDRIEVMYLNGSLSKYQSELYLFSRNGTPLFNIDTGSYHMFHEKMVAPEQGMEDMSLSFRENAQDGHLYLAEIPIKDSDEIKGFLFVDMALKRADNESAYPELLQPANVQQQDKRNYASAVYYDRHLLLQSGEWSFPVTTTQVLPPGKDFLFADNANYSELHYRADARRTVVVIYRHKFLREGITLFSYLFGMLMLMNLLVIVYRQTLRVMYKFRFRRPDLTMRMRIHYTILGVMLLSFLVIGIVTVTFLNNQYAATNETKLQEIMQVAGGDIEQYLFTHHALDTPGVFKRTTREASFKYFITSIANRLRIDINVFATDGTLNATSQSNIYDKDLLAPIVRPDAYQVLRTRQLSSLLQHEQIEQLSYLSSYMSLHNSNGTILGFVNVPYFSSEKELHLQISNILVALINLYAFVFIVSSFFAFLIARNITGSLNIIISQFKNINLRKNELLEWPHKDEIGRLIEEYNKMVKKVEENAAMLVQHEREGAWREMAKQIAHEIKNPLTPMKLNIQYLQNALHNKHPNVEELATRVSASIIEQIDNLSYIASEFSNFAKMPEARPEELELNDLLERAVQLYRNEQDNITVDFHPAEMPLYIHSDKSQLLRVCTNLLQNAVQAIDGKEAGKIDVKLIVSGSQALISFADNGNGIPEDAQDKIFKPYFTTKTSGTGLGLAMTRKIIELWKGHIWFETAEGEGTTFYIMLPLVENRNSVSSEQ